jgi:hypothetical protein
MASEMPLNIISYNQNREKKRKKKNKTKTKKTNKQTNNQNLLHYMK